MKVRANKNEEKCFEWQEDYVEFLIECVKTKNVLWNPRDINFKNKGAKRIIWLDVIKKFNEHFNENLSYAEALKKWNNLKTYFSIQKQKFQTAKRSGAGMEESESIEENGWKYYNNLLFLYSNSEPLPSVNNFNSKDLQLLENNVELPTESEENFDIWYTQRENMPGTPVPSEYADFREPTELATSITRPAESSSSALNTRINILEDKVIRKPLTEKQQLNSEDIYSSSIDSSSLLSPPIQLPYTQQSTPMKANSVTPSPIEKQSSAHPRKRKRVNKTSSDPEELMEKCLKASNTLQNVILENNKQAEETTFGKYIDEEMKKLDSDLQIRAKRIISNAIYEIMEEQIKRN